MVAPVAEVLQKADASGIPTIWPSILPKIGVALVEVLPPVRCSDLELSLGVGITTLGGLLVSLLVEWQTLPLLLVIVLKFELCLLRQAVGLIVAVALGFTLLLIFEFPLKLAKLVDTTVVVVITILWPLLLVLLGLHVDARHVGNSNGLILIFAATTVYNSYTPQQ
ncbi:hypothetical protein GQX74_015187 [Glossina fuscipes]|nr:hypothetical protein GQX74_015187 [Glossina fuscipes]